MTKKRIILNAIREAGPINIIELHALVEAETGQTKKQLIKMADNLRATGLIERGEHRAWLITEAGKNSLDDKTTAPRAPQPAPATPPATALVTTPANDMVNRPAHYCQHPAGIEVIEITEHENFCIGNAIKYLMRHRHKGEPIQDLKKAQYYIQREIKRLTQEQKK